VVWAALVLLHPFGYGAPGWVSSASVTRPSSFPGSSECQTYLVRRIEIVGLETVRDRDVRRRILLGEADPYDEQKLITTIDRINRLGRFEPMTRKDVQVAFGQGDSPTFGCYADLTFTVREKKR
jgi:outer membrane protein assembly factor BamA